jgi:predicted RND superfamily exporter protein
MITVERLTFKLIGIIAILLGLILSLAFGSWIPVAILIGPMLFGVLFAIGFSLIYQNKED